MLNLTKDFRLLLCILCKNELGYQAKDNKKLHPKTGTGELMKRMYKLILPAIKRQEWNFKILQLLVLFGLPCMVQDYLKIVAFYDVTFHDNFSVLEDSRFITGQNDNRKFYELFLLNQSIALHSIHFINYSSPAYCFKMHMHHF